MSPRRCLPMLWLQSRADGGCRREFSDRDLQHVRCHACGRRGHLSCASVPAQPAKLSCHNCGQGGHSAGGVGGWRVGGWAGVGDKGAHSGGLCCRLLVAPVGRELCMSRVARCCTLLALLCTAWLAQYSAGECSREQPQVMRGERMGAARQASQPYSERGGGGGGYGGGYSGYSSARGFGSSGGRQQARYSSYSAYAEIDQRGGSGGRQVTRSYEDIGDDYGYGGEYARGGSGGGGGYKRPRR